MGIIRPWLMHQNNEKRPGRSKGRQPVGLVLLMACYETENEHDFIL